MMRIVAAAGIALALSGHAHAKEPSRHAPSRAPSLPPPPVWVRPAPPLPMLPRVGRVRVEAARDRVVILEDVHLPRGDWESGGLDLYIAFGTPGAPIAIDARLMTLAPGAVDPRADSDATGEVVTLEHAVRRTSGSQPLLGKPHMAGVVAHVRESQLERAYAAGDTAVLRIRSLLAAPVADETGARDVVVRLGIAGGLPLTLGRIQVASLESRGWITRAEATLCGAEADPWPLAVTLVGKTSSSASAPAKPPPLPIAPDAAQRHASDDLCIRWWTTP
jgi:hypothetical protein